MPRARRAAVVRVADSSRCVITALEGPAPSGPIYDTPAFRESMIAGIAAGTGESSEVAACILDNTLALGFTMDDFVLRGGDEDVVAARTDAATGCVTG